MYDVIMVLKVVDGELVNIGYVNGHDITNRNKVVNVGRCKSSALRFSKSVNGRYPEYYYKIIGVLERSNGYIVVPISESDMIALEEGKGDE